MGQVQQCHSSRWSDSLTDEEESINYSALIQSRKSTYRHSRKFQDSQKEKRLLLLQLDYLSPSSCALLAECIPLGVLRKDSWARAMFVFVTTRFITLQTDHSTVLAWRTGSKLEGIL